MKSQASSDSRVAAVQVLLQRLFLSGKQPQARALIASYKVTRLSELPETKLAGLLNAAAELDKLPERVSAAPVPASWLCSRKRAAFRCHTPRTSPVTRRS